MQDQYNTKPSLEAQIQSMLNQVMDDDEITNDHEDGLEFSEESEDESSSQYIEYNPNQFNPYTNFFTRSHPLKTKTTNPPYYETLPQQNHRNYKKYQTVSFYQTNQPYPLRIPITNTKPVYYPPQMTYTQFPSPEPKVFKRSDKRKTYYTMKGNQPKIQNINNNDRRFNSLALPHGTSIASELFIHELNTLLLKSEKIDHFIYSKLQGNFVSVIKTHKGSRIFQNYLKNTQSDILHQIFAELSPLLCDIMSDPYANYFCKRLFSFLNQKDRIEYLNVIKNSITSLSKSNIGTYPIQGIIEEIGSKLEKNIIINSIKTSYETLCFDANASHVIEKIISSFEEEYVSFIYTFCVENFLELSTNSNAICVIRKIITFTHKKDLHEKIKRIIKNNALSLIQHPYGNYVIQGIIETWDDNEVYEILGLFEGKYSYLSMQKYSSNLVERCIEKSTSILNGYIKEVCDCNRIGEVMKNHFGNYVIQKALKLSKGEERRILIDYILKNVNKLNNKKLVSKWQNLVLPYLEGKSNLIQSVSETESVNINIEQGH